MIRIQKIQIHEFRGIRDLTIDLRGENFAVCGPNGTGKSGVVDAIEFALTGNISRLSGRGTGELSIKDHGPHVDSRSKPEQAYVALTFKVVATNKEATITRTVKTPSKPTITPDDTNVKAAIEHLAQHPEFVLSRRELIQYVLAEPSKRSEEVQALLRMEKIESLRGTLQKICNAHTKGIKPLENARNIAKDSLLTALGVTKWSTPEVLAEVNKRRVALGLAELKEIEKDTSFKDGLATVEGSETASRIPKAQALKDIEALQKLLNGLQDQALIEDRAATLKDLNDLNADADSLGKLTHETLLQSALKLYDEEHCPVCDTEWKPEAFKEIVNQKLQKLAAVKEKKENLEKKISPIALSFESLAASLNTVAKHGPLFTNQSMHRH
jgi:DNA repair exonuclease SbcCD ATPase subunit